MSVKKPVSEKAHPAVQVRMEGASQNPQEDLLKYLKQRAPEIFTEGKIDVKRLKMTLGEEVEENEERYGLSWAGKSDCFHHILEKTAKTVKPAREESVNFDETENLFIEGDNLEALKILEQNYRGKIKMIYIDPPYNTGNDFIYNDTFSQTKKEYLIKAGAMDEEGNIINAELLHHNTRDAGHFHSNWLNMMYPRLFLARNWLRDDGVIFVSIDDNEVANLRKIMDEIFGDENFVAQIVWEKRFTRSNNAKLFATLTENVLLYRKSERLGELKEPRSKKANSIYANPDDDPRGPWTSVSYVNPATKTQRPNLSYIIQNGITGKLVEHPTNAWKYEKAVYERHAQEGRLYWGVKGENKYPRLKKFLSELEDGMVPVDLWDHETTGTTDDASKKLEELFDIKIFDFPKPIGLIQRMLRICSKDDDHSVVLDFFAGSGTTAHAVMKLNAEDGGNRKWICVQLPEICREGTEAKKAGYRNIAEIAKERIRRAAKKIKEEKPEAKIDDGFKVFKIEDSNFKVWNTNVKTEEELKQQILDFENNVLDGAKEEDLLFELLMKNGLELNAKIEKRVSDGKAYFAINSDELVICLDEMSLPAFMELLKTRPKKVVLLDRAFVGSDELKANILLRAEDEGVEVRTV
jgi:adenine-specific DNA-methyltransferase